MARWISQPAKALAEPRSPATMVIMAVSITGRDTDVQMPIPTPPTSPAAVPHTAYIGIAAVFGDACTVVAVVIVLPRSVTFRSRR
ncbi:hypothetical protein QCN29_35425 [Streptomyces sp. HNM0663]|uniref:Uncharacterized protein n=1 Tax=Streptomyces chengmaiensis TaxID=3040919 RepID=A0ABT6I0L3_9ACTN|nr:hypothetical protein [Streptomyces chengmaiensis]MDH2393954.1 hypothetical protein [Streptomyces chengmaiensis]